MTSRSWQYIPWHWDACCNHSAVSDFYICSYPLHAIISTILQLSSRNCVLCLYPINKFYAIIQYVINKYCLYMTLIIDATLILVQFIAFNNTHLPSISGERWPGPYITVATLSWCITLQHLCVALWDNTTCWARPESHLTPTLHCWRPISSNPEDTVANRVHCGWSTVSQSSMGLHNTIIP